MANDDADQEEPDVAASPHVVRRRLPQAFVSVKGYGLVLLLIVATYVAAVSIHGGAWVAVVLYLQIGTVWFALRTAKAPRPIRYVAFVLMAYATVAGVLGAIIGRGLQEPWFVLAGGLLYLIAPFTIVQHIALRTRVDRESMLGAISAYVLIGIAFAYLYRTVALAQSGSFFGEAAGDGSTAGTLFFSFTTLTTTGYGNLVPATNPGQTLAVIEMILGQLFLITAVGKLVTAWRPRRWPGEEGSVAGEDVTPGRGG